MTEKELIEDVQDELTFSRALPFALPEKEIKRIIKIASRYFYENWRHAVDQKYILLPKAIFETAQFKQHRQIQFPECIRFVTMFREVKHGSVFGTIDRDFSEQKWIGSEMFLTPFMGESIVYRTVVFSFLDLTKSLILETIAYDYNKNQRVLTVTGRTPKTDAVVQAYREIPKEELYKDELFQRYVRAKGKVRLGELMKTFDYKLPGGININYEITVNKAEAEFTKIEEQMGKENTPDFIILDRQ